MLVLAIVVLNGCFAPTVPNETPSGGDTDGNMTSGSTGTTGTPSPTSTDGPPSSGPASSSSSGSGSSSTSSADTSSTTAPSGGESSSGSSASSSSTGPAELDPYGQCTPGTAGWEVECPAGNSDLGCGVSAADGSVCLPDCTDAPDSCPAANGPTPPFCIQLVGGRHACLLLCQEDGHCPEGMACQEFASSTVCAWPS